MNFKILLNKFMTNILIIEFYMIEKANQKK